ncbi:hypothetical protein GQ600_12896 [Phytophthora cactorum]|nr:hypothetical protein GQ600_12896 [Phytophthora cactorum]
MGDSEPDSIDAAPSSPSGGDTANVPWSVRIHEKRAKAFVHDCDGHCAAAGDVGSGGHAFKRIVPWSTNDGRACKRRYLALTEAFGSEKLQKLRGAGTPAMNAERAKLLAQCQLMTDEDHRRRKATKDADRNPRGSKMARTLSHDGRGSGDQSGKFCCSDGTGLDSVAQRPESGAPSAELELEERRMKLEERRVKLEEQRFEQQRQTTEKQMEMMSAQTKG